MLLVEEWKVFDWARVDLGWLTIEASGLKALELFWGEVLGVNRTEKPDSNRFSSRI